MLDTSLLSSIARQLMAADEVEAEGKRLPVRRTSRQDLKTVTFVTGGRQYAAIEQNREKPSRWGGRGSRGKIVCGGAGPASGGWFIKSPSRWELNAVF
jgi:hypothetical protein